MKPVVMPFLWSLLLTFNFACATTQMAQARFAGVDAFGSRRVKESDLIAKYGREIDSLAQIDEKNGEAFFAAKTKIEATIRRDFNFPYVQLSIVTYFQPHPGRFLTIDIVEPEDVKERMPFLGLPKGSHQDPEGAIALWQEYEALAFQLLRAGDFKNPTTCPVWHCTLGFEHPKLAPYLPRLNLLARKHERALVEILRDDADSNLRAGAAFLLAHIQNGQTLVKYLMPAVYDSSELVRNNVIRILFSIALVHSEVGIPVEPFIRALHFPGTTDRNKAGWTLAALSKQEENKKPILRGVGWVLFDMLKLKQPNNHDPAFSILKTLSDKTYGERDYQAWQTWLASQLGSRNQEL